MTWFMLANATLSNISKKGDGTSAFDDAVGPIVVGGIVLAVLLAACAGQIKACNCLPAFFRGGRGSHDELSRESASINSCHV